MTINQVWTEKYRPQNIEDVILNDKEKEYFSSLKEVPNNLLLVGSPGIGKCLDGDEVIEIFIEDTIYNDILEFLEMENTKSI